MSEHSDWRKEVTELKECDWRREVEVLGRGSSHRGRVSLFTAEQDERIMYAKRVRANWADFLVQWRKWYPGGGPITKEQIKRRCYKLRYEARIKGELYDE